jgi:hypothetical protein
MSLEVHVDAFGSAVVPLLAVAATLIGVWFANNYRRQMNIKLAEGRREAYARLWVLTGLAAPTRLNASEEAGPLSLTERQDLHQAMTDWYYAKGNGMLLAKNTRQVYLHAKHNLVCEEMSDLKPKGLDKDLPPIDDEGAGDGEKRKVAQEKEARLRGILSIKQLSLLRTQLKSDLAIYGDPYTGELEDHECRFLWGSGVDLGSKTWAKASGWNHRFHWAAQWGDKMVNWVKSPESSKRQSEQWKNEAASTGEAEWHKPQRTLNTGSDSAVPISARDEVAKRTCHAPSDRAKQSDDPTE